MLEAEKAGGGGSGEAKAAAPDEMLGFLPGGEMLQGVEITRAPEMEEERDFEPDDERTLGDEGATGEEGKTGEKTLTAEEQAADAATAAAAGKTADGEPSAEELAAWPEAARARYTAAAEKLKAAETEKSTLAEEVARLKTATPAPVIAPTQENPLSMVGDATVLDLHAGIAREIRDFATRALATGAEMPKHLQAVLAGVKPEELTEARNVTPEEAASMLAQANGMLERHIPARQRYLQSEAAQRDFLKTNYPTYLDPKTEEGKTFDDFVRQFPQVKQLPHWPGVVAAAVRGHLAFQADQAARAEAAKGAGAAAATPAKATTPPGRGGGATGAGGGTPNKALSKPSRQPARLSASMDGEAVAQLMLGKR